MGTESTGFVRVKGLGERVKEAESKAYSEIIDELEALVKTEKAKVSKLRDKVRELKEELEEYKQENTHLARELVLEQDRNRAPDGMTLAKDIEVDERINE